MAGRPHKEGLDYFSLDVDFFENKKVRRIMRACGPNSATILICLLCNTYRNKGYYIGWDEDLSFDIADTVGVSEGAVSEVMTKALQVEFFSPYQFKENKILTSPEIQSRYLSATGKRQEVRLIDKFSVFEPEKVINDTGNSINGVDNEQSKEENSKVKKSKVVKANAFGGSAPPAVTSQDYEKALQQVNGKPLAEVWCCIRDFIANNSPEFIEPYLDAWNIVAKKYGLAKIQGASNGRLKKFKTRLKEPFFDYLKILAAISKSSYLQGKVKDWKVDFDWVIENDTNYLKIIEEKYD